MNNEINSLSSSIMFKLTLHRNQPGSNKWLAELGYVSCTVVAAVESVAALTSCMGSAALYPATSRPLEVTATWLKSSSFCIIWSVADLCLNPLARYLVADERSARQMAWSGELGRIPEGAVI
jgi:hypothetical protein